MGTGLMEPASKFSPQITCTQVHWQHRGCWGDWPSGSWVSCEECPTKKTRFQAWEVLKSRRMWPENPWELTLPEPLLNQLQKAKMISLKSSLSSTHALCVQRVHLYCEQSETSVKAYNNIYWTRSWKNTMCYLSSKYYFYLLLDMPLTISYSDMGIWLFEGNRWVWGGRDFLSKCLIVQTSYLSEWITNKKHPKRARKALQKHLFPAQCLLLVLRLSKAFTPTAPGGSWQASLRWQSQCQCPAGKEEPAPHGSHLWKSSNTFTSSSTCLLEALAGLI